MKNRIGKSTFWAPLPEQRIGEQRVIAKRATSWANGTQRAEVQLYILS